MKYYFLLLLIVIGCGGIKQGKVIDKWVQPAHYETVYIMVGKILVPRERFIEERYCITICDSVDHKYITSDVYMYKNEWDSTIVGQEISFK